jgi:16S rRNA (adenine1518-N6/adenine1519-N6)-dimethyltransferase
MPRFLGQHFLKNDAAIKKIVAAIGLRAGETIIEIGPGHGELTIPLAAAAEKVGASVIAVEKDAKLADALRARITIANADILGYLESEDFQHIRKPFKLVGNIPYYLTGHLLRIIGGLATGGPKNFAAERCVFTIQKEVAERICAEPPRMNRLAASVQFWAVPKIIARIPRGDFSPPPAVDSAVIQLDAKPLPGATADTSAKSAQYYAAVRALFAQPRKTAVNNLVSAGMDRKNVVEMLQNMGVDEKSRPQNLTIKNIWHIAEHFSSVHK